MSPIQFATNAGEIAGGEVMLLAMADAARALGCDVTIVAPSHPGDLLDEARARGFRAIEIKARSRRDYALGLRAWERARPPGLLWCNGLLPALATAGRRERLVHLHQLPQGRSQWLALAAARMGSRRVVVPSESMAAAVGACTVLPNWVPRVDVPDARATLPDAPVRLGFIGRFSVEKGVVTLAEALGRLDRDEPGRFRLLLAGGAKFVPRDQQDAVTAALSTVSHLVDDGGWMDRAAFFSSIDLAVFPSIRKEAFGLVVAEAQSARVPFVITDAGGLPEVAGPGYRWVAKAGDPASLADMIRHALAEVTPEHLDRSLARWQLHFSPDAGRRHMADLLTDLGVLPGRDVA